MYCTKNSVKFAKLRIFCWNQQKCSIEMTSKNSIYTNAFKAWRALIIAVLTCTGNGVQIVQCYSSFWCKRYGWLSRSILNQFEWAVHSARAFADVRKCRWSQWIHFRILLWNNRNRESLKYKIMITRHCTTNTSFWGSQLKYPLDIELLNCTENIVRTPKKREVTADIIYLNTV